MAALTIASTDLNVSEFEELPPRRRGDITVSFANTLRSSVSSEKREFRTVTSPVNRTTYQAIQAAFTNGASATVTGDVLLGSSLTCKGTVGYSLVGIGTADAGYNFLYTLVLNLREA